jgi:hypothetical protein
MPGHGAMYHVRVDPICDFLRNDLRHQAWEVRNALRPRPWWPSTIVRRT